MAWQDLTVKERVRQVLQTYNIALPADFEVANYRYMIVTGPTALAVDGSLVAWAARCAAEGRVYKNWRPLAHYALVLMDERDW